MNATAKERLLLFIKHLGVGQTKFENLVGLSNGYVSKLKTAPSTDKLQSIVAKFPELSPTWLISGEGPMLRDDIPADAFEPGVCQSATTKEAPATYIPLIHIDSVGGIHSQNSILTPEYTERFIPVPDALGQDVAIRQSGTSMLPGIPSGAVLQLRAVEGWREYIGYGNVFVLLLEDGRRITKEIRRYDPDPANYFWCVSYNPDVADEELPKSMIVAVWKVIRIFLDLGW